MSNRKINKAILLLIFIMASSSYMVGQEKEICKSWAIDYYTINGKKKSPNVEEKKNTMTFSNDGSFSGIEENISIKGKWKLDAKKRKLILSITGFPEKMELKIIKINDLIFVWEAKNTDDGSIKRTFMIPKQ